MRNESHPPLASQMRMLSLTYLLANTSARTRSPASLTQPKPWPLCTAAEPAPRRRYTALQKFVGIVVSVRCYVTAGPQLNIIAPGSWSIFGAT